MSSDTASAPHFDSHRTPHRETTRALSSNHGLQQDQAAAPAYAPTPESGHQPRQGETPVSTGASEFQIPAEGRERHARAQTSDSRLSRGMDPPTMALHELDIGSRPPGPSALAEFSSRPAKDRVRRPLHPSPSSSGSPSSSTSKRPRLDGLSSVRPVGIEAHPDRPPLLELTPTDYRNEFSHLHPWGCHVVPRRRVRNLSEESVTSLLPTHVYRHIPKSGYLGSRFVRTLFPRRFRGEPSESNPLPIMELMRLEDIIAFRQHAVQLLDQLLSYQWSDDTDVIRSIARSPKGPPPSLALPPARNGVRPVLYQVVARNYGQGVLLEAKDLLIPGTDHGELLCIPLVQDSINAFTNTRGFDRNYLS
ncbi:unnamed protein product, partial [Heligmosomoides polygyrus]|uniref:Uncharacterized protein n=1 Tax=Heligmosomoides polygyrus TaxID=6339 RepID=A0A183FB28_HELPZ